MKETERFVRIFDRFFDMLNTRSMNESIFKRKPDLAPYRTSEDTRLMVNLHGINLLIALSLVSNGEGMCLRWGGQHEWTQGIVLIAGLDNPHCYSMHVRSKFNT